MSDKLNLAGRQKIAASWFQILRTEMTKEEPIVGMFNIDREFLIGPLLDLCTKIEERIGESDPRMAGHAASGVALFLMQKALSEIQETFEESTGWTTVDGGTLQEGHS